MYYTYTVCKVITHIVVLGISFLTHEKLGTSHCIKHLKYTSNKLLIFLLHANLNFES